jgi:ribosomal protein S18 acetylase RimI-like enzyme
MPAASSPLDPRLVTLRDGDTVLLRAQVPGDRELLARLFAGVSARTRYLRFHTGLGPVLPRRMLDVLAGADGEGHVGALAVHNGRAVAAARYIRTGGGEAELAFTVDDAWQRRGLGRLLVSALVDHAAEAGLERLRLSVLGDNAGASALARAFGARGRRGAVQDLVIPLSSDAAQAA